MSDETEQVMINPDAEGPLFNFDIRFEWTPCGDPSETELDSIGGRGTAVQVAGELRRFLESFERVHRLRSAEDGAAGKVGGVRHWRTSERRG